MKVINFTGGPGHGKSTAAYSLAGIMKEKGYNVELITEYPKVLAWSKSNMLLSDQIHVFAEQHKMLAILKEQVEYVVTDSPIFLSGIYAKDYKDKKLPDSFFQLVLDMYNTYDNATILLNKNHDFVQSGRIHNEQQAVEKQNEIIDYMLTNNIDFDIFNTIDMSKMPLSQMLLDFCIENNIIKNINKLENKYNQGNSYKLW